MELSLTERQLELILDSLGGHSDWLAEKIEVHQSSKPLLVAEFKSELLEVRSLINKFRIDFDLI